MGGNALKKIQTHRLNAEEYDRASSELCVLLTKIGLTATIVQAYHTKESYGDIDVVIEYNDNDDVGEMMSRAYSTMSSSDSYRNSNVLSLDWSNYSWPTVQVDLIFHHVDFSSFALHYYSYNDLGNLIGRIAHKMGFRFGHDGLWLPMRDGDNLYETLLVTRDINLALRFLGFDEWEYSQGFDTLEDIFKYVSSSKFFNKNLYPLEHRNAVSRIRDAKRQTYMKFLRWLPEQNNLRQFEFPKNKLENLSRAFWFFPELSSKYFSARNDLEMNKRARTVFNGDLVKEWTGLGGKELGVFMQVLRNSMQFDIGRLSVETEDQVKLRVMEFVKAKS